MYEIDMDAWNAGRALYHNGGTTADVAAYMHREHEEDQREYTPEANSDWRVRQRRANSYSLGFVQGIIDDLRARRGGLRA